MNDPMAVTAYPFMFPGEGEKPVRVTIHARAPKIGNHRAALTRCGKWVGIHFYHSFFKYLRREWPAKSKKYKIETSPKFTYVICSKCRADVKARGF